MKKIFLIAIILFAFRLSFAEEPKTVKPTIRQVTVFLNRAQLTTTSTAYIEAGTTDIALEGLPPFIDPQSIQVTGKGDFVIMGVKHALNYLDPQKKSREVKVLEDSIEHTQFEVDMLKNNRDVYMKEEQMLLANQSIRGEHNGVSPDALEDMADFFRDRLIEIRTEVMKDDLRIKKLGEKLSRLQNQLNELNKVQNRPSATITVTVSSKAARNAQLDVDFIVTNAGWYPIYDLRAKDSKGPVQMMYKAQVYQTTGMDWNNVKLTLSTANPAQGGTRPNMYPWYLNFYEPVPLPARGADKRMMKSAAPAAVDDLNPLRRNDFEEKEVAAENISNYTQMTEGTLAAEFDIAIPYTIPSGGHGQLVDVQSYQLPATYRYSAVPKLDKDAFLVAMVTGWDGLNLLSGNANIYFEGTYVGQSFLDIQNTKDTLELSLGRDKKVVIERKTVKDFTTKKFIGTNRKEDYAYEIIVRNTKKDPVEIVVEDQIPVSQNNQIEVTDVETPGAASVDSATGKVTWKLTLEPAQTKSITFKYSVKYPKNKVVGGL